MSPDRSIDPDRPLRIILVEDHQLVRAAVGQALDAAPDLEVVAQVGSAEEALELVLTLRPDVALIDIDLPGMRGPELVRELAPRFPDLWAVMLTISRSERDLLDSIRSGARGYLHKDLSPDALVRSIRDIRNGVMPMSRKDASLLIGRLVDAAGRHRVVGLGRLPELTSRENEVLALLAEGLTDREISVAFVISRRTVESHVRNILDKLGVQSRLQAARLYRDRASQEVEPTSSA
jgi:two-component system, NarL family, response regulator DevR